MISQFISKFLISVKVRDIIHELKNIRINAMITKIQTKLSKGSTTKVKFGSVFGGEVIKDNEEMICGFEK
jgi:hypothetical protein